MPEQPAAPLAPTDSDALLVERAAAGDHRAYELLVIKYQRRIERLIGRMVRDVDLVQDARSDQVDRYGRRLGYIEVGGRDVGDELIRSGLVEAWWPRSATTPIRGSAYRSAQEGRQRPHQRLIARGEHSACLAPEPRGEARLEL